MDANTKYDIEAVIRRLEAADESLRDIPWTCETASAWNKACAARCDVAYSVGYLQQMLRSAAALEGRQ